MNTTAKLAEKAKQALACMRGLQQHLGQSVCEVESQELAAALAAHEQAQADDWQHLKPYGYAPGNYMSRCRTCGDTPVMDKRAITCRPCAEAKFAASQAQA